ncbi:MAG TPA: branched-chain amino acid ABC transporter ATP-binding protein/permease [Casimicrobiaceae bacterium]|nr:branched-chain amino acid ABC transporter ATP-binding protein/permease [Casimicrobiaceae bacterium]
MGADRIVHAVDPAVTAASGTILSIDRTLVAIGVAGAALAVVPLLHVPAFYESFLYLVFHWIVLATSWNILSGYSGYFSFGHGAFYGAGVYTTAVLAGTFDMPFLWTLPIAGVVAATLGVALGAVVFRVRSVRGEIFALLTLAVTFVLATIVLNTPIDGGPGIYLSGVRVPTLAPTPSGTFYVLSLALAVATLAIARFVATAPLGTGLFAIHDDEDAAEVTGVPTYRYKLIALGLSCTLAGIAGGIHALFISYVTAGSTFNITVPLTVVLMSVLGGTRHWAGPALGATAITLLLYASTAAEQAVAGKAATGAILIAAVLFMPDGILGLRASRRRRAPLERAGSVIGTMPSAQDTPPVTAAVIREPVVLLSVRGLRKAFSGVQALDSVDVDVIDGEILGVLGPNGSGKSTLINVISGHYRSDAGSMRFAGVDITHWPAHRIAGAGIARTYQIPRPFAHLTVHDNVALAAMFGAAALDRHAADTTASRWLRFTALAGREHAYPRELNLHQTKFLELARALAAKPRLLLLDEVLSGLTPAEIDGAVELIRRIRDQRTTIVIVEHVMRVVTALSDRIVVLDQGRVLAQGNAADVMARDDVATAYLGVPHA